MTNIDEYTQKGYWGTLTYPDYMERNAKVHPHKEALVDSCQRLTFKEFGKQVEGLVAAFLELDIGKGDTVALQLPNCCEYFLSRYALAKIGAISLSAPITLRKKEIQHIVALTKPKAVICHETYRGFSFALMYQELSSEMKYPEIIIVARGSRKKDSINLPALIKETKSKRMKPIDETSSNPNAIDALGLTSGTTSGLPKIIKFTPNNRFYTAREIIKQNKITADDTILLLSPLMQGFGNLIGLAVSAISASKVILHEHWDAEASLGLVERERPTIIEIVPAQLAKLISSPKFEEVDFSHVRFFLSAGAALPCEVAMDLLNKTETHLVNVYGAHDGGIATISNINMDKDVACRSVGKALPGMDVKVVNKRGEELPQGEVGEVIYRGPGTPAYFEDSEATTKVFDEKGYYHSGDLGRLDKNGYLQIIGRSKDLIIRGGQNVDPKLVEGILARHPDIAEIAVVGMPDKILGERICAYIVLINRDSITLEEITSFLKKTGVAVYNFPERIEIVAELPISGGGKVMKEKLRADIKDKIVKEGKKNL